MTIIATILAFLSSSLKWALDLAKIALQNKYVRYVLIALALLGGSYWLGHHNATKDCNAKIETAANARQDAILQLQAAYRIKEQEWQASVNQIQIDHDKEMQDATKREVALRAAVESGARKLRIQGICPRTTREATGPAASGDATAVELAPTARGTYFSLRAAIIQDQGTIKACQAYIRTVTAE